MEKCSPEEMKKIKSAVAELSPIAEKAGVSVAELIEQYDGEESDDSAEEADDGKVDMIVARMKAKNEDYEG